MASILLTVGALAAGLLLIPELFGDFTAYQIGLYLIYGIAAQGIGLGWGFSAIGGLDAYSELYYLIVAVTVAVAAGLLWLNTRPLSVLMRAVSANEPRVQILGCASHRVKGFVFALSAGLAVVAGGLFASHQGIVTPTASGFALSAELVIFAAIGGRFHVLGPLIGAVVVGWVSAELRDRFAAMEMAMALTFIVVVMRAPGGLAELVATPVARWLPARRTRGVGRATAPPVRHATHPRGLEFASVQVESGVVRILNGTQFSTPDSGVVCVIGPNGAGKTSVLNAITGPLPLTSGAIRLGGERIDGEPPYRALRQGVGRKLQVPSVFTELSVQENVMLGAMAGRARWRDWFATAPFGWSSPALRAVLDHPDVPLIGAWSQPAGTLPQGDRQYLRVDE